MRISSMKGLLSSTEGNILRFMDQLGIDLLNYLLRANMTYFIDEPIYTKDYKDFNTLFAHVDKRFAECFSKVYQEHYK